MTNIIKLWVDDIRLPPDGWFWAKTSEEAILFIKEHGIPEEMSLDHDLGGDDTVMVFLKWLAGNVEFKPFRWKVHSQNPIGKKNIEAFLKSWQKSQE